MLVDALEAAARLLVAAHGDDVPSQAGSRRPTAAALLAMSAMVRSEIHQPIAPTEAADLAWTRARLRRRRTLTRVNGDETPDAASALAMAVSAVRAELSATPPPAGVHPTIKARGG